MTPLWAPHAADAADGGTAGVSPDHVVVTAAALGIPAVTTGGGTMSLVLAFGGGQGGYSNEVRVGGTCIYHVLSLIDLDIPILTHVYV